MDVVLAKLKSLVAKFSFISGNTAGSFNDNRQIHLHFHLPDTGEFSAEQIAEASKTTQGILSQAEGFLGTTTQSQSNLQLIDDYSKKDKDVEIRKFIQEKLPQKDRSIWYSALILREQFSKGEKEEVNRLKTEMSVSNPGRGGNIANLCTAGYLESHIKPLYEFLTGERGNEQLFLEIYETIVTEFPFAVFVSQERSLKDLLGRVQEREGLDAILVLDTDRIARNTLDHLTIKSLLQKASVPLISISQPMIDDSPEGNLIDTIIASVNAFQSQITGRKVSKVAEEKAKAGYYPGKPKTGYMNVINSNPKGKFDKRTIDIDPERGKYVTQAFTLYSTGNFSLKSLSNHLFELGFRSNTGGQVGISLLAYCLRDPLYLGKIPWKGVIYEGHHPALTDEATFNKCQEIMTAHNQNASRQRKHNFLLRGFVFCADCGRRLWAETHTKKSGLVFGYYFCKTCGKDSYEAVSEIENQVEEWFGAIQITKAYAEDLVERAKQILEDFRSNSDDETQTVINRQSKIEAAMREAEDNWLIRKTLSDEAFRRIYDRYEADLKGIKKQLNQMVDNHNQSLKTVQRLMALAQNIRMAYYEAEPSLKRFYLGLFWQKFLVKKGKIINAILAEEVKALIRVPKEPPMLNNSTSSFLQQELNFLNLTRNLSN